MSDIAGDPGLSVSVVVPVLNAAAHLPRLLEALFSQQPAAPREVLFVDNLSTDATRRIAATHDRAWVVPIANFSHGRARNLGARLVTGEIVVLLTQDALPKDSCWLAALLEPFADECVAATYSRQVARDDSNPMERFFLRLRFPAAGPIRRHRKDHKELSLEEVFFSNVSAAIRRKVLLAYPFDEALIMSEDQQWARDVINAGYSTVYQPRSVVVHSHDYSLSSAFRRFFDSVYSLTLIFPNHRLRTSASMGMSYVRKEFCYILRHFPATVPYYLLYTAARTSGTILGHFAERLPRAVLRKLSYHPYHWRQPPTSP